MSDVTLFPDGWVGLLLLLDWILLPLIILIPSAYITYIFLKKKNMFNVGKIILSITAGVIVSYFTFLPINNLFNFFLMNIHNIIPGIILPLIVLGELIVIYQHAFPVRKKKITKEKRRS